MLERARTNFIHVTKIIIIKRKPNAYVTQAATGIDAINICIEQSQNMFHDLKPSQKRAATWRTAGNQQQSKAETRYEYRLCLFIESRTRRYVKRKTTFD